MARALSGLVPAARPKEVTARLAELEGILSQVRLEEIFARRELAPPVPEEDPWKDVARWLWARLATWALDATEQAVGPEAVAALPEEEKGRLLYSYLFSPNPDPFDQRLRFLLSLRIHAGLLRGDMPALKRLLDQWRKERADSPLLPLRQEEHLTVLSAAHYQAVREALYKKGFERVEGVPWPTAPLEKPNARGQAQLRPVVADARPLMPPEEVERWAQIMWRQREDLSDLDADVLDALSAIWLAQARTPQDEAVAEVDDLLALRGIQPKQGGQGRRGGYEPEQRASILQALSHIQNLWINMTQVEVYPEEEPGKRRRKPSRQAIQSRAFVITDRMGQLRLDGYMDVERFIFRPGKVFAHFLFGPGRQTALLSAKALEYDPYRQLREKRLTRFFSHQWRCRAHTGNYAQPFRVATLLEAAAERIGISPQLLNMIERGKRGKRLSPETEKRIEKWLTQETP